MNVVYFLQQSILLEHGITPYISENGLKKYKADFEKFKNALDYVVKAIDGSVEK